MTPSWKQFGWLILAAGICIAAAEPATAQSRSRTYRPATPTMSPYLGLLRRDSGALPNYYTFVRPQQELQATVRQQDANIGNLQNRLQRVETTPVAPTGVSGGFMNYSNFYQFPRNARGRARR